MRGVWGSMACIAITWAVGCTSDRAPRDAPCRYNSDCADALVCAASVCRSQCQEDRDCESGSCSASGVPGVRACLPPASPVLCAYHSECPEEALCIEQQCRAQCREDRDCEAGAACTESGTCDAPLTTPPDTGPDAGAPDAGMPPPSDCPTGEVRCRIDGQCHHLPSDPEHCGACGRPCAAGGVCESGICVCGGELCAPINDDCAGALEVDARPSGTTVVRGTGARAMRSHESCDSDGRDVFYRFELEERSIVHLYADGGIDVYAAFLEGCGEPVRRCATDCSIEGGELGWHRAEVLDPGIHHFIVGGFAVDAEYRARLTVVPIGDTPAEYLPPGESTLSGTLGGNARGMCGGGARHAYYFPYCTPFDRTLSATSCGTTPTVLELFADPFPSSACGTSSASCADGGFVSMSLPGSTSLGVLFVEAAAPGASGDFTLTTSR